MKTADLLTKLQHLADIDPATVTDKELFNHTVEFEELLSAVAAKAMPLRAAVINRKAFKARKFRSAATGMARETRLSSRTCGARFNLATLLINDLGRIYLALDAGVMNPNQVNVIYRYASTKTHREYAIRDQAAFIDWANNPYPIFCALMERWAEVVDDTDPNDEDEKAMADRRLVWAYGIGKTVLIEWDMPVEIWEEMLAIATPVYDAFLKAELKEAKDLHGDDIEFCDLARSDKQRWCDAFITVFRRGGAAGRKLAATKMAEGFDPGEDTSDDNFDPGVQAEVVIICDQITLEREIARRNGETLEPRPASDAETYRCETLSGASVSPSTALNYLELNSFRRMMMKPGTLDFEMSRSARYFRGPQRTGLIARDRTCQGPGCGTSAKFCQGDHIEPHSEGGPTLPTNGEMLCGPCHRWKTWLQAHGMWDASVWDRRGEFEPDRMGSASERLEPDQPQAA